MIRGKLSLVATPIGNLEDITLRAVRVLSTCDGILAEDTRRTRILCQRYEISTRLFSLHAHSAETVLQRYVDRLLEGAHLALVSDAGTPLVSDPGAELVAKIRVHDEAGRIDIEVVPGPSAVIAALNLSGVPFSSFLFLGFLPQRGARRRQRLQEVKETSHTLVFFEAPHRLVETLHDLGDIFGHARSVAVCRELTKIHEQCIRGSVKDVITQVDTGVRGEITVVVAGAPVDERDEHAPSTESDVRRLARAKLQAGASPRDVLEELRLDVKVPKRELYRWILSEHETM